MYVRTRSRRHHVRVLEKCHQIWGVEQMEGKLNGNHEVNSRAVSRGQNELIGKFKMAARDVISIRG